jgi:glycosyltransferase involved in cell wall biosynthesis
VQKIIYINSVSLDEISGQGSFERNFTSYLNNNEENMIKVFTINNKKNYIEDNVQYIKLNKKSKFSYITYQIYLFYFLLKELINSKKNNTFIYIRLAPYNFIPFVLAKLFNINLTIRSGPVYQNLILYNKVKKKYFLYIFKLLLSFYYRTTSSIVVVTQKIKDDIVSDFNIDKNKITIISNPINNTLFDIANTKIIEKEKGYKYIGFVGNIYEEQGVQHIIEAIKILDTKNKLINVKVLIIGDGSYLEHCKELTQKYNLENTIDYLGIIEANEVVGYINIFDICLAPFTKLDYEIRGSSGLKIVEYLYCNKPVITIDVHEYKYIKDNDFGLLYLADDVTGLANNIEKLLLDNKQINSKEFIKSNFTKEVVFKKYINIIKGGK